jgi:hypothetical protein
MVTVVIDAPFHFDDLVSSIFCDDRVAPVSGGLVIVNTNSGVVATWSTPTNLCFFQVRPSRDWFKDGAFGAGINASLISSGQSSILPWIRHLRSYLESKTSTT